MSCRKLFFKAVVRSAIGWSVLLFLVFATHNAYGEYLDNWYKRAPPVPGRGLWGISYGNDTFVIVGEGGTIMTSPDGITWTSRASGTADDLNSVSYLAGVFLVVGETPGEDGGGTIVTSPDGATWTRQVSGTVNPLNGIAYGNNTFVAVGDNGTILTSSNPTAWSPRNSGTSAHFDGVTFGGSSFVAVGKYGTIKTSDTAISWASRSSGTTNRLHGITHGNNTFVAVGENGTILTSPDGSSWASQTSGTTAELVGIAFGNGNFVIVGDNGAILSSPNVSVWTLRESGNTNPLAGTAYGNGTFVVVGEDSTVLQSAAVLWPLKVGDRFTYRESDSDGVQQDEHIVVTGTVVLDDKPYFVISGGDPNAVERYIGSTETSVYTVERDTGEEREYHEYVINQNTPVVSVSVPYGGPFQAYQFATQGTDCTQQDYIVLGLGIIKSLETCNDGYWYKWELVTVRGTSSLTLTRSGTGSGTITSSPSGINCGSDCSETYNSGTVVTLSASPSTGSSFTGWSGGGCSGTGTCTVTMNTANSVTATFTLNPGEQYSLTVDKSGIPSGTGSGTITSSPSGISCGSTCSAAFDSGTQVTLTVAPASGSYFYGWPSPCSGNTATCSLTVTTTTQMSLTFGLQSPSYYDTVQKCYIGYYQRPADPVGLLWWAERLKEANGNLNAIIEAFAKSDESKALYGEVNNDTISGVVDGIYMGLLSRSASKEENDYWSGLFKEGKISSAAIMLIMLNGAQNEDLTTINNKLTAANRFTRTIDPELDGADLQATYAGNDDAEKARGFLTSVTTEAASVPDQDAVTDYIRIYIADPGDGIL